MRSRIAQQRAVDVEQIGVLPIPGKARFDGTRASSHFVWMELVCMSFVERRQPWR